MILVYLSMWRHLRFLTFALAIALVMALLEVQIEGAKGWAAILPTWRKEIYFPLMGMWANNTKPLTGYHLYLWMFSFTLPHVVFLFTRWTFRKELYLASFYIFFSTFEGILWFVVNPAFGWKAFNPSLPWYEERWVLGLPGEYWVRFTLGAFLYIISQRGPKPLFTDDK